MKIKVNYDFTHYELVGAADIIEVADGSKLGDLLRLIDSRIMEAGRNKGIETTYKTTMMGILLNLYMGSAVDD